MDSSELCSDSTAWYVLTIDKNLARDALRASANYLLSHGAGKRGVEFQSLLLVLYYICKPALISTSINLSNVNQEALPSHCPSTQR
jgi:uncharacterized membrane protein